MENPILQEKKILVHRNGKTFYERRKTRDGEEPKQPKKRGIHPEALKRLKSISKALSKMAVGSVARIGGVLVKSLKGKFYGVQVHGERILVHGAKAAAALIDYVGLTTASGASVFVGDVSGASVDKNATRQAREAVSTAEKKLSDSKKDMKEKPDHGGA